MFRGHVSGYVSGVCFAGVRVCVCVCVCVCVGRLFASYM